MMILEENMVYCTKCGTKNDDSAEFCKKCGDPIKNIVHKHDDEWEKRCEEECSGGRVGRGWSIFWALVIIIIGIWIIFELVLKELAKTNPSLAWVNEFTFEFWWVILAIFALMLIITGLRIIIKPR
jgi:uncharacterized membrane protein YvbJ